MEKIIFIMDDSEAFLRNEVLRISSDWGFIKSNVKSTEVWNAAMGKKAVSLFGEKNITHLDLSDANKLKNFVSLMSDKNTKSMFEGKWFGEGLIITSTIARGTKKIEDLVKSSKGEVIKKAKPKEIKKNILNRLSVSKDVSDFLDAYAGDDYQLIIGVVNQIEDMEEKRQKALSIEEVIVRLPGKPGSLPPWEFVNPMLEGNTKEAIELYERSVEGSHVLVTAKLAKSKLQLLYRLKMLQENGVSDSKSQAELLGERNGPNIWLTAKVAQKIDKSTAEFLAKLSVRMEADLKGHSNVKPDILFKNFIATVCLSIKYNRSLHLKL